MNRQDDKVDRTEVARFESVSILERSGQYSSVENVSFDLPAGHIVLIRVSDPDEDSPITAAALGLISPDQGRVEVLGQSWDRDGSLEDDQRRSRIGYVAGRGRWISNLDVLENITLSERHHTHRSENEIEVEAKSWLRRFGASEAVLEQNPAFAPVQTLRVAEWARAFMGQHRLILLDRPTRQAPSGSTAELIEAVTESCTNGTAVIWVTSKQRVWDAEFSTTVRRFELDWEYFQAV